MIGALIGDVVGSRFEWRNHKSKDFELFHERCRPTDDSIMSLAVAKALLESAPDYQGLSGRAVACMQAFGRAHEDAGYGRNFNAWIWSDDPKPYNSYGNGAAMRVGPCGFAAQSIDEAMALSDAVTRVTHNHPEGMKGAQAVAVAIFLARTGASKKDILCHMRSTYYPLDFTIDEIRDAYHFDVSCQGSVPVALQAFFESADFEDAIRTAISVGGDSDTIGAITGSVAEAFYGVPREIRQAVKPYFSARQLAIVQSFEEAYPAPIAGR